VFVVANANVPVFAIENANANDDPCSRTLAVARPVSTPHSKHGRHPSSGRPCPEPQS
jgi:hypothetical protein